MAGCVGTTPLRGLTQSSTAPTTSRILILQVRHVAYSSSKGAFTPSFFGIHSEPERTRYTFFFFCMEKCKYSKGRKLVLYPVLTFTRWQAPQPLSRSLLLISLIRGRGGNCESCAYKLLLKNPIHFVLTVVVQCFSIALP